MPVPRLLTDRELLDCLANPKPHTEPLLADDELISPQTEVSESNASGGKVLEVTPVKRILSDRELLDRVVDTEWDSASSRLLPRRSARLKAKKIDEA
ncbi:unnamed protein product [Cuscuta epithymum]|uniref:Uncharacterized protein n=1 Tax=Cuscuta epithymum TaxID=186058 RepID=A0AAV0D1H7_9ASTE|nr:unnamed protein product [Cuscuta epithymum]